MVGGKIMDKTYGEFQAEMDMFNQAFCEVMLEGDAKGRVFTFPIPTINVTRDFDWDSPVVNSFMEITCKYGIPYFSNYINSDLSPEDALSMCCRLRLNTKELRKRGGGPVRFQPHDRLHRRRHDQPAAHRVYLQTQQEFNARPVAHGPDREKQPGNSNGKS